MHAQWSYLAVFTRRFKSIESPFFLHFTYLRCHSIDFRFTDQLWTEYCFRTFYLFSLQFLRFSKYFHLFCLLTFQMWSAVSVLKTQDDSFDFSAAHSILIKILYQPHLSRSIADFDSMEVQIPLMLFAPLILISSLHSKVNRYLHWQTFAMSKI